MKRTKRKGQSDSPDITDRERILSLVINGLMSTALLKRGGDVHCEQSWQDRDGHTYVHFAYYRKPVHGDLVIGRTGFCREVHRYSIGFWQSALPDGAVIREIGSDRLCNYTNEEFTVVAGLHPSRLLEGERFKFVQKVQRAFVDGSEYSYRYGGTDFLEDGFANVWVREVFGGMRNESVPFAIKMAWTPKTTVKKILEIMRAGGYGTKSFRPEKQEVST